MKIFCRLVGCNKVCSHTTWAGEYLLQFFGCSRCGEKSPYCGFVKTEWVFPKARQKVKEILG